MVKKLLFLTVLFWFSGLQAQETESSYKTKKVIVSRDTIHLEQCEY